MRDVFSIIKEITRGSGINVQQVEAVTGGDINSAYCCITDSNRYFIKLNSAGKYPGMLEAEAKGLELLGSTLAIKVPGIVDYGIFEDQQFLLLEWIESGNPKSVFWEKFGKNLSRLHSITQENFGLHFGNYMGSLPQANQYHSTFSSFYAFERLLPMVKRLNEGGLISANEVNRFDILFKRLPQLIPEEPAALIHGDLWAGNFLITETAEPVLIDPAPCFAHRELDIAMTRLFGGFDRKIYEVYHYYFPLEVGFEERTSLMQLYPLLVHAVLFGGNYVKRSLQILASYTK